MANCKFPKPWPAAWLTPNPAAMPARVALRQPSTSVSPSSHVVAADRTRNASRGRVPYEPVFSGVRTSGLRPT